MTAIQINMPAHVVRPQLSAALVASAVDVYTRHSADFCGQCGETDCQLHRHAGNVLRGVLGGSTPDELRHQAAAAVKAHRPRCGVLGDLAGRLLGPRRCRRCRQLWPCLPYRSAQQVLAASTDADLVWLWTEVLNRLPPVAAPTAAPERRRP